MKVLELFSKREPSGADRIPHTGDYSLVKRIGNRWVLFVANEDSENNLWELQFLEWSFDGEMTHELTGSGDEVKVFSFILNALSEFIADHHPRKMKFSAREPSRVKLYTRMVNRFAKDYDVAIEKEQSPFSTSRSTVFTLTHQVTEGQMKRSDPFISGERDPKSAQISTRKPSDHEKKITALATKANVSVHAASAAWDKSRAEVDPKLQDRWMIVMRKTKEKLGLV